MSLILLIFLAVPLWSNGGADTDYDAQIALDEINTLIQEKQIDEAVGAVKRVAEVDPRTALQAVDIMTAGKWDHAALDVLADIARKAPDWIEEVVKRVEEIQSDRLSPLQQKKVKVKEALENGESDLATRLLDEIYIEYPNLPREERNDLIFLSIEVSRREDIRITDGYFVEARVLLDVENFLDAVDTYRLGMSDNTYRDLARYNFYMEEAPTEGSIPWHANFPERQVLIWDAYSTITPRGEDILRQIQESLDAWKEHAVEIPGITDTAAEAVENIEAEGWIAATRTLMEALNVLEQDVAAEQALVLDLESIWSELYLALEETPEEYHFDRQMKFMNGRGEIPDEGIFHAQEQLWANSFLEIAGIMSATVESEISQGQNADTAGNWPAAAAAFDRAAASASALDEFLNDSADFARSLDAQGKPDLQEAVDELRAYGAYVTAAVPFWQSLVDIGSLTTDLDDMDWGALAENPEQLIFEANAVQQNVTRVEALGDAWNEEESGLSQLPKSDASRPSKVSADLRSDLANTIADLRKLRLEIYRLGIEPMYNETEAIARAAADSVDADTFRTFALGDSLADNIAPERHPSLAADRDIVPALTTLERALSSVDGFLQVVNTMLESDPPIEDPEAIEPYIIKAEVLKENLEALIRTLGALEQEALAFENAALEAETSARNALDRARRDLESARSALQEGEARNNIDSYYQAIDLYDRTEDSLEQVDDYYWQIYNNDRDIAEASGIKEAYDDLISQVGDEKEGIAITVQRNAVTEGNAAYDRGDYTIARSTVVQAQDFWTNVTGREDPVLKNLLDRIDVVLNSLQDKVIDKDDPLYSEMNQYLNLANRYYEAGVRIADEDRNSADAILSFEAAEALADQVLGAFPGNTEAKILKSKIEAYQNADSWERETRNYIAEANGAVNRSTDNDKEFLETDNVPARVVSNWRIDLNVLQSLEVRLEVRPNFPNLRTAFNRVFDFLYGEPEATEAEKQRSREFTARADSIWTTTQQTDLQGEAREDAKNLALDQIDLALGGWPENQDALNLRVEIIEDGDAGAGPGLLRPEVENLVRLGNDALNNRVYGTARAIADVIEQEYPDTLGHPTVVKYLEAVRAIP